MFMIFFLSSNNESFLWCNPQLFTEFPLQLFAWGYMDKSKNWNRVTLNGL